MGGAHDLGSLIAGLERVAAAAPGELRTLGERATQRVRGAHDRSGALARMTDLLRQSRAACFRTGSISELREGASR
jgi:hypothetical protein